jgi:hypothetical protein
VSCVRLLWEPVGVDRVERVAWFYGRSATDKKQIPRFARNDKLEWNVESRP